MIEFPPDTKLSDLQDKYSREDLIAATHEMINRQIMLIKDLPDSYVTFEPEDPEAHDAAAEDEADVDLAWTLGHIIVHTTASSEEACARGASLARGVKVEWRDRSEVPWQDVRTIADLLLRLEQSRRIRLAYLNAWPDKPYIHVTFDKAEKHWGKIHAVGMVLNGLRHDTGHLPQMEEIIRQARAALG